MIKIDQAFIGTLVKKAAGSERRRTNYNFHKELSDTLQRMLNVMNTDTYVCPHKHITPDKREAFILIKGKVMVLEFDEGGNISDYILLDREKHSFGCEIKLKSWHTIVCLEDNTVLYEVKDGPYDAVTDKVFAPWAPKEGDLLCLEYNQKLINEVNMGEDKR
jgi:cupin fold WbuC family metalloprotein